MPKRSTKRAVGLNERYFSSKFHGHDVNRLHKKFATTLVKAAAAWPPKRPIWQLLLGLCR